MNSTGYKMMSGSGPGAFNRTLIDAAIGKDDKMQWENDIPPCDYPTILLQG
jgi:hypothetical protein